MAASPHNYIIFDGGGEILPLDIFGYIKFLTESGKYYMMMLNLDHSFLDIILVNVSPDEDIIVKEVARGDFSELVSTNKGLYTKRKDSLVYEKLPIDDEVICLAEYARSEVALLKTRMIATSM